MTMAVREKIELVSSTLAALSGIFYLIYFWGWPNYDYVVLFISGPVVMMALGAYLHVKVRENLGIALIILAGLVLCVSLVLHLIGGLILFGPFFLPILGTCLLGILCLLSTLLGLIPDGI